MNFHISSCIILSCLFMATTMGTSPPSSKGVAKRSAQPYTDPDIHSPYPYYQGSDRQTPAIANFLLSFFSSPASIATSALALGPVSLFF